MGGFLLCPIKQESRRHLPRCISTPTTAKVSPGRKSKTFRHSAPFFYVLSSERGRSGANFTSIINSTPLMRINALLCHLILQPTGSSLHLYPAPSISIQLSADSCIHMQQTAARATTWVGDNPRGPELCKPMNELPSSIDKV